MDNKTTTSGGIGILTCIQIIFIVLKCVGVINWTWVQVLIPTFINIGLILIVLIVMVIIAVRKIGDKPDNSFSWI